MSTLRWPAERGRFVDRDPDRVAAVDGVDDVPLDVAPGDTVTVSDSDVAAHYQDRGWQTVDDDDGDDAADSDADAAQDGSGGDDTADESPDDSDFDVEAFVDRTPVADVVDDIEAGEADGHLDAVADADDRVTVEQAVKDRKSEIRGD